MRKFCPSCRLHFTIHPYTSSLLEKLAPELGGRRYPIPYPTLCPECRKQRRLAFRNDFSLYRRKSTFSGNDVFTIYSPDKPFSVYSFDEWWSDSWDPMAFGRPFDFSRPFFEQFAELRQEVPRIAVYCDNFCQNCDYSNQLTMSKNCYLLFSGSSNEDCYYGYRVNNCRNCSDCLYCLDSELCFQCIDAAGSYNCRWSRNINNCSDSAFLLDCQNCSSCLFCVGLRNQSYCIFNKPCSKEQFARERAKYNWSSGSEVERLQAQFAKFSAGFPRKFASLKNVENVTGDNIQNARNCDYVFDGANLEHVYYAQFVQDCRYSMDVNFCCDNTELHYEVSTGGIGAYQVLFSVDAWPTVSNILYCDSCSNGVRDCFGCVGLRQKQYCILNRQYSKTDYEQLVGQILEHMGKTEEWGQFFPAQLSPFGYNESTAFDQFPLNKEEALQTGFSWRDEELREAGGGRPPDDLSELEERALTAYACRLCGRGYRITRAELSLYRQIEAAPPANCFFCRHGKRRDERNPRRLWSRSCSKCSREVMSTFAPDRREEVLCEECYTELVT